MITQTFKRVCISHIAFMMMASSFADQFVDSKGIHYETTSDSTVEVVNVYDGYHQLKENTYNGDVKIPESVIYNEIDYQVTSIGNSAFAFCPGLLSIEIPKTVTLIKRYAFCKCSGLKAVKIPDSVISIEDYAFDQCSGLESVDIPNSVTKLGVGLFSNCTALQAVKLPSTITSLPGAFFVNCKSMASFEIPSTVTKIENEAFKGCSSLSSVTFPNSLTAIGGAAFSGCTSLKSINIPNSVKRMDDLVFEGCIGLTSLVLPELNRMGYDLFTRCTNLSVIYVPTDLVKYMVERSGYQGEIIVGNPTITEDLTYRIQRSDQIFVSVSIGDIFYDRQEDVGFEYREQGANEEKPIRVSGVVFDHKLEGVISNLQKEKTYEVRPYGYDWRKDIEVQGQWTAVTVGEPSFYDPFVCTYSDGASVTPDSVILYGAVLCGSDDILEQGFEYWPINDSQIKTRDNTPVSEVQKVFGENQVMHVRIDNFSPVTTYGYRTYASTAATTIYGEEYTFTTMNTANSIGEVDVKDGLESKEGYINCIYDIKGHSLTTPRRGINIFRMNDGSVKKVLVR